MCVPVATDLHFRVHGALLDNFVVPYHIETVLHDEHMYL